MKIGIIGAGKIGGTLARRSVEAGHDVVIANSRGPETLTEVAQATGAEAVQARDVAAGSDIVVLTIPQGAVSGLPDDLFDGAGPETPIIDTGNYYPRVRDDRIDAIEEGMPESRWVEEQIGRPVVKTFSTVNYVPLGEGKPSGAEGRKALPVAGANGPAKELVMRYVDEIGFDPVDAGEIADSWRQQPETPVYGVARDAESTRAALAEATPERPPTMSADGHGDPKEWT